MNKIKNVHSPAGYKNLTDCPKCKWGTVDKRIDRDNKVEYRCADCQWKWSEAEWELVVRGK